MKKAMLGLSGILLASGIALAADYSKLSDSEIIKSLENNSIAKNEQETLKKARDAYMLEKKSFFNELKKRIENAPQEDKEALEKALKEYKSAMYKEMKERKAKHMGKMPHKEMCNKGPKSESKMKDRKCSETCLED